MTNEQTKEMIKSGSIIALDKERFLLGFGPRQWTEIPPSRENAFYFPDFFLKEKRCWCLHPITEIISKDELIRCLTPLCHEKRIKKDIEWSVPEKEPFNEAFYQLQGLFSSGILKKAVPYACSFSSHLFSEQDLVHLLLSAFRRVGQHDIYLYGFWDFTKEGNPEGMLGLTPEVLFKSTSPQEIETMACAGTMPIAVAKEHLLNSTKDSAEHSVVVEDILERLSPLGEVSRGSRHVKPYGTLCHLITPLTLTVNENKPSFVELIKALHPTPALGAFPREAGSFWLHNYAKRHPRKRFGAPVGCILSENGQEQYYCYVAIRNVQWDEKSFSIMAGCGVIAESDVENEWKEILLKLHSIKEMLELSEEPK